MPLEKYMWTIVAKSTNTGLVIICIKPLNSKSHMLLAACIWKTDMKSLDSHVPGNFEEYRRVMLDCFPALRHLANLQSVCQME